MNQAESFEVDRGVSRNKLRRLFLLLGLAALFNFHGVTAAFCQEEVTPTTSEKPAPYDLAVSQVLQIPLGSFVEVQLTDGGTMRGKLGELLGEGFLLRTVTHHHLIKREVRYAEVQSIRPLDSPKTKGQAFDTGLNRARKIAGIVGMGVSTVILIAIVAR